MPARTDEPRPEPPARPRRRPAWHQPELAWPLALATGFGGTGLGLALALPGLGPLLAFVLWAPFHVRLVARGKRWVVALAACAWVVAIAGAVSGMVLETSPATVRARLFLADPDTLEVLSLDASRVASVAWIVLLALLVLGTTRVLNGVGVLLVVAFLVAAVSGAAGEVSLGIAEEARRLGEAPFAPALLFGGWPPWLLPCLVGLLVAAGGLGAPGPLLPPSDLEPGRRRQILVGLGLLVLSLLAEPLYGPAVEGLLGGR